MTVRVEQIYTNSPLRNFSYLVYADKGPETYCIDPYHEQQILGHLQAAKRSLTAIINTHEHGDHTHGNAALQAATRAEIWAHANARGKVAGVQRFLHKDERLPLGRDHILVLDTPGHTFAHLCLMVYEAGQPQSVLTGDTLFNAGVGNCRNGGDPQVLYETIRAFGDFPDDIKVYPGHDYWQNNLAFAKSITPQLDVLDATLECYEAVQADGEFLVSTLGLERKVNHFLRLQAPEVREGLRRCDPHVKGTSNREIFLRLRQLRDQW